MKVIAAAVAFVLIATPALAHEGCDECSTWKQYRAHYLKQNEPETTNERVLATRAPDLIEEARDAWKDADAAWDLAHSVSPSTPATVTDAPEATYYASTSVWDAVAACEGGGNWSLVTTGNGYYFVLQFAPSTWLAYGGTQAELDAGVAPSRSRLIQVAEAVLAGQGPGAWPNCYPG